MTNGTLVDSNVLLDVLTEEVTKPGVRLAICELRVDHVFPYVHRDTRCIFIWCGNG